MVEESAYVMLQRAKDLLKSNDPVQAAFVLEKACKLEPEKGSIREALGRAYYNAGQHNKAKPHFEKCVEIDPTNHYAHYCLGLCHKQFGNRSSASRHFKLAIAMHPESKLYSLALRRLH